MTIGVTILPGLSKSPLRHHPNGQPVDLRPGPDRQRSRLLRHLSLPQGPDPEEVVSLPVVIIIVIVARLLRLHPKEKMSGLDPHEVILVIVDRPQETARGPDLRGASPLVLFVLLLLYHPKGNQVKASFQLL